MPMKPPPRPPSGAAGRLYVTPAHRKRRLLAAEREIDRWLTTFPVLSDDDRRALAARLMPEDDQ